jgi:hypothetical protein
MKEPHELKGPRLVRALPQMASNLAEWSAKITAGHPGEMLRVCLGRSSFLIATEPAQLQHVLLGRPDNSAMCFGAYAPRPAPRGVSS